jgi:hypothetical protein
MAKPSWDRSAYRIVLGVYGVLALSSTMAGQLSWDEETDYLGLRDQLSHALRLVRGENPDYHTIHANLEFYGTVGLLPAWLLWFLQRGLFTGRFSLDRALHNPAVEHQLTGFFTISHTVLLLETVLLSLVVVAMARQLALRHPWLTGAVLLATPTLLGHSFTNTKDVPFALFYSLYTLGWMRRTPLPCSGLGRSPPGHPALLALLGATLLVNQKLVALVPVLLSEAMFALWRWRRGWALGSAMAPALALPTAAVAGALLLQPAAWGQPPWRFLAEAFTTFAVHSWGGCMWFDGQCVGIHDPSWSAAGYMLNWLGAKLPLLLLLLPLVQALAWLRQGLERNWPRQRPSRLERPPGTILPLMLQLLLLPALAAARDSNLYDADRHLLFVVPPLAVLAVMGFERLQDLPSAIPPWRGPKPWALALVALLALGQVVDDLLLHPYQLAYFNEMARHRLNHTNTSVDYWAVSAKEAVQQAQLRERLPVNPTAAEEPLPLPLAIGFRQLGGRLTQDAPTRLIFQVRNPPDFQRPRPSSLDCANPVEVSRRQLLAPPLVMSRLIVCRST